jgi:predicted oxidoreductase
MSNASTITTTSDGPTVSRIVAGTWRLASWDMSVAQRVRWIEECVALGISTFDHADIYGQHAVQALFGEALRMQPALRHRLQIVTKCGIRPASPTDPERRVAHYDTSPAHIERAVDRSLADLCVERIDVLLIHRPDALMDFDAVADCFLRLRAAGKVAHFGASNFAPAQFAMLHRRLPLATHQVECSPLHLQPLHDGTLDQAQDLGIAPMIWSALAGGRLLSGEDENAVRTRATLTRIAEERGISVSTLVYAWLLRHPARPIPLTGSRRIEVMADAVAALGVQLDAQTWYEIWQAGNGRPVP